jgi:hypothetical protein
VDDRPMQRWFNGKEKAEALRELEEVIEFLRKNS